MSTCPINRCGRTIHRSRLMCREHWFIVPTHLRDQLLREYRPGQERDHQPSDAYIDAMVACIRAVNLKVRAVTP